MWPAMLLCVYASREMVHDTFDTICPTKVPITNLVPGHDWSIVKDDRVGTKLLLLPSLDEMLPNTCSGLDDDDNNSVPGRGGGQIKPAKYYRSDLHNIILREPR